MSMDALYAVYGASGFGREVMPLARHCLPADADPARQLVFVDDHPTADVLNGHPVLTPEQFLCRPCSRRHVAVAIADGEARRRISGSLQAAGVQLWSVRAPQTVVLDDVSLGEGSVVCGFVTLTSNIRIGCGFHANIYSYVAHDCVVGDFVTFAPAVRCNGNVVIEDGAYIGTGAVIRQGRPGAPLVIGRGAVVGMGAVVTRNVEPHTTVVGNPARPLVKAAHA